MCFDVRAAGPVRFGSVRSGSVRSLHRTSSCCRSVPVPLQPDARVRVLLQDLRLARAPGHSRPAEEELRSGPVRSGRSGPGLMRSVRVRAAADESAGSGDEEHPHLHQVHLNKAARAAAEEDEDEDDGRVLLLQPVRDPNRF